MAELANEVRRMDLIPRCTVLGSACLGTIVGMLALVIGLLDYPVTAGVALIEGGILGAVAGGLLGLLVGVVAFLLVSLTRRLTRHGQQRV